MSWFTNLKIAKKLGLGFALVLMLTTVMGVFSIMKLKRVNASTQDVADNWLPTLNTLGKIRFHSTGIRRAELNHVISENDLEMQQYEDLISADTDKLAEDRKEYEPTISSDEERRLYDQYRSQWDQYLTLQKQVLQLSRQQKDHDARVLVQGSENDAFEHALATLADDVKLNEKGATDAANEADAIYESARVWVIGLLVCAIAIGAMIAYGMSRSISGAVFRMTAMIREVSANNLAIGDMDITSQDEIGQAGIMLNNMKNNLHDVIQSIAGTAAMVASASEKLSSTSQQISANSEETSAQARVVSSATEQVSQNLQTVATGAEEMGASIKEIAKNATEAASQFSHQIGSKC